MTQIFIIIIYMNNNDEETSSPKPLPLFKGSITRVRVRESQSLVSRL